MDRSSLCRRIRQCGNRSLVFGKWSRCQLSHKSMRSFHLSLSLSLSLSLVIDSTIRMESVRFVWPYREDICLSHTSSWNITPNSRTQRQLSYLFLFLSLSLFLSLFLTHIPSGGRDRTRHRSQNGIGRHRERTRSHGTKQHTHAPSIILSIYSPLHLNLFSL